MTKLEFTMSLWMGLMVNGPSSPLLSLNKAPCTGKLPILYFTPGKWLFMKITRQKPLHASRTILTPILVTISLGTNLGHHLFLESVPVSSPKCKTITVVLLVCISKSPKITFFSRIDLSKLTNTLFYKAVEIARKPYGHLADMLKDVFFVIQIGRFVAQGSSFFLLWVFNSLCGILILPYVLSLMRLIKYGYGLPGISLVKKIGFIILCPILPVVLLFAQGIAKYHIENKRGSLRSLRIYFRFKFQFQF